MGKDGYENHREIIETNATMRKKKFKNFINSIKNMQNGLLVKHGVEDGVQANDYKLMNLSALYKPTRREILRDKLWKMRIPYDYKMGLNRRKLDISSFGGAASLNVNHGIREWFRRKWEGIINWFHSSKPRELVSNIGNLVKQYAIDILSGKIKISDVPSKFKGQVMQMIRNGNLTQTPIDDKLNTLIGYADKLRSKKIGEADIPENYRNGVLELMNNGPQFDPKSIVPTPTKMLKSRVKRIVSHYEKHPGMMRQKHMQKLAMYRFLKEHPRIFAGNQAFSQA